MKNKMENFVVNPTAMIESGRILREAKKGMKRDRSRARGGGGRWWRWGLQYECYYRHHIFVQGGEVQYENDEKENYRKKLGLLQ